MSRLKVLIVHQAVVVRRLVAEALAVDPALEVVGAVASARLALARIPRVHPDLVIVAADRPEMEPSEPLAAIRARYPGLPVLVFDSEATARVREDLIPKIRALVAVERAVGSAAARGDAPERASFPRVSAAPAPAPVSIVAIGVSTGGPDALATLLPELPAEFPVPIVIVQHMPPLFTRRLAERLAAASAIDVREGAAGERVQPGLAWLAPGDYHMLLMREGATVQLQMHQGPRENSCRPSVDVLFHSVAALYGPGALAVVLTGMGRDGLRGCEAIRRAGGEVWVQNEASSVVWGMPGCVAKAGLADRILPLGSLGHAITRRVQAGHDDAVRMPVVRNRDARSARRPCR